MSETLDQEKKEVTVVESVSVRGIINGFIVDVSGRDSEGDWATDSAAFTDKQEAIDFMSAQIGG